jgi:hypothetical protein
MPILQLLPSLFESSCIIDLAISGQAIKWQSQNLIFGSAVLRIGACSLLYLCLEPTKKELKTTTETGIVHHLRIEVGDDGRQRFILNVWGKLIPFGTRPTRERLGSSSSVDITNILRQIAIEEFAAGHGCNVDADLGDLKTKVNPFVTPMT